MPLFGIALVQSLVGVLAMSMSALIGRAMIALGIGFVTYKGIGAGIDALRDKVVSGLQGMPADMVGLLGYLWIDKALSVVMSATAVALSIKLIQGSLKRMVVK